jgi:hypothetical protein
VQALLALLRRQDEVRTVLVVAAANADEPLLKAALRKAAEADVGLHHDQVRCLPLCLPFFVSFSFLIDSFVLCFV